MEGDVEDQTPYTAMSNGDTAAAEEKDTEQKTQEAPLPAQEAFGVATDDKQRGEGPDLPTAPSKSAPEEKHSTLKGFAWGAVTIAMMAQVIEGVAGTYKMVSGEDNDMPALGGTLATLVGLGTLLSRIWVVGPWVVGDLVDMFTKFGDFIKKFGDSATSHAGKISLGLLNALMTTIATTVFIGFGISGLNNAHDDFVAVGMGEDYASYVNGLSLNLFFGAFSFLVNIPFFRNFNNGLFSFIKSIPARLKYDPESAEYKKEVELITKELQAKIKESFAKVNSGVAEATSSYDANSATATETTTSLDEETVASKRNLLKLYLKLLGEDTADLESDINTQINTEATNACDIFISLARILNTTPDELKTRLDELNKHLTEPATAPSENLATLLEFLQDSGVTTIDESSASTLFKGLAFLSMIGTCGYGFYSSFKGLIDATTSAILGETTGALSYILSGIKGSALTSSLYAFFILSKKNIDKWLYDASADASGKNKIEKAFDYISATLIAALGGVPFGIAGVKSSKEWSDKIKAIFGTAAGYIVDLGNVYNQMKQFSRNLFGCCSSPRKDTSQLTLDQVAAAAVNKFYTQGAEGMTFTEEARLQEIARVAATSKAAHEDAEEKNIKPQGSFLWRAWHAANSFVRPTPSVSEMESPLLPA